MGTAANVKMGVCEVFFGPSGSEVDLGYTKGGVKVTYSTETTEKTVDQEDAPIDEYISKQTFEAQVPLAESDLEMLASLLPGATFTEGTQKKLVLTGEAGVQLSSLEGKLILKPMGGTVDDWLTFHHALPVPSMDFAFEKENVRVYNVTFRAVVGTNGWVVFGDETESGG
jgi:hypothetical protein